MPGADGPADVTEIKQSVRSSGLFPQLLQGGARQKINLVIIVYIRVLQSLRRGSEEFREHELVGVGASVSELKPCVVKEVL